MSEFAERTYWDPYSRTHKPVLTEDQVKNLWPYKEAKHKRTTMDDAMPNLAPKTRTRFSNERVAKDLGYAPRYDLTAAADDFIAWLGAHS